VSYEPNIEIPDSGDFYENWGHPEIEFKWNFMGMLISLLKHDRHWREASGAEGEWAALSGYGDAMHAYCYVEWFYTQELGLSITWNAPPVIEDYLGTVHEVVSVLTASQEGKLCASWRKRADAAWSWLEDAVREVRGSDLKAIRFDDPFNN
jgi:hypothetical protein